MDGWASTETHAIKEAAATLRTRLAFTQKVSVATFVNRTVGTNNYNVKSLDSSFRFLLQGQRLVMY